ncbi:MAG: NAD(P)H-dependent oxidoreductase subunit E, partial [Desulfofustis sp.]|nr:NAD(P)H-dependent oxidoreductase subunit E [Desulfofustis sp.]
EYSVKPGETTADGKLSLATARCLGSCGLAPVLVVDDEVLGKETPESTLQKLREVLAASPDPGGEAANTVNRQEQEERAS